MDALLPALARLIERQMMRRAEIEHGLRQLVDLLGDLPRSFEPAPDDGPEVRALRRSLKGQVLRYEKGWREVQETGAVVKDPQRGLLDFYGQLDGRLVWFCWKYGEESLGYYHELEAGFAGRRALERSRLLN